MTTHERAADERLARFRHPGGAKHPVYDFLFEYYPVRPSHLRRWHPGAGYALAGQPPHADWKYYRASESGVTLDADSWWERRGATATYIRELLVKSADNPTTFDCFGLHEWAMVYQTDSPRHSLPLRLGPAGTNRVVEDNRLKCSHYDAFRFFTPAARPLNLTVLHRKDQPDFDQAGCVHATMDLYKWAWKLGPVVPGDLFLATFDLAVRARVLDMEASPYDCRSLGFGVVEIETPAGKAEYVRRQRELAGIAKPLRQRLVDLIDRAAAARLSKH